VTGEPIKREPAETPGGLQPLKVMDEVNRLKRLGIHELRSEARACRLSKAKVAGAATGDELRLAILEVKLAEALGGEPTTKGEHDAKDE
jgi:hypothetical protein